MANNSQTQLLAIPSLISKWRNQKREKEPALKQIQTDLRAQRNQFCIKIRLVRVTTSWKLQRRHAKQRLRSRPWAPFQKVHHRIVHIIANYYAADNSHTRSTAFKRVIIARIAYIWTWNCGKRWMLCVCVCVQYRVGFLSRSHFRCILFLVSVSVLDSAWYQYACQSNL